MRASNVAVTLTVAAVLGLGGSRVGADAPELLAADAAKTTVAGNTFVAPAGWSLLVKGPATILEAPEGGSFVVLVDVPAKDAKDTDAAVQHRLHEPVVRLHFSQWRCGAISAKIHRVGG